MLAAPVTLSLAPKARGGAPATPAPNTSAAKSQSRGRAAVARERVETPIIGGARAYVTGARRAKGARAGAEVRGRRQTFSIEDRPREGRPSIWISNRREPMVRGPGGKEVDEARASCVVVASAAMLRRLRPLLLACAALLVVQPAVAKDSVQVLANRLLRAEDFRVRTQAALALGASNSDKALVPLCKALTDVSTTVRAASATALGRLRRGGKGCLERRRSAERSAAVKASIDKALQQLGGDDAEPAIDGGTKVYLAIGKTTDKTGRDGVKIDRLVRTAMPGAARSLDGYVIAPASESKEQATKRLGAHKHVRAFYLLPKVQ